MKILIVSPFFPPRNVVAARRAYSWLNEWRKHGHEVTVLTATQGEEVKNSIDDHSLPFILRASQGRIFEQARRTLRENRGETDNQSSIAKSTSLKKRLLQVIKNFLMSSGVLASVRWPDPWIFWRSNALKLVANQKFDVVVSTFGPVSSIQLGAQIKKRKQTDFFVADFRDLWTENSAILEFFVRPIERILERRLLKTADLISTVSAPLADRLKRLSPGKKVAVIPNGVENRNSHRPVPPDESSLVSVAYTGSLYLPYQSPRPLFKVLRKLRSTLIGKFRLDFFGPNTEVLRSLVREFELDEIVKLNGLVSREESVRIQEGATALLFLESTGTPGREGIVTGKIYEYFVAKRPILAIGVSEPSIVGRLIAETESGVCLERDEDRIEASIMKLLTNRNMGVNPKGLPDRFERGQIARDFLNLIESEFEIRKNALAK